MIKASDVANTEHHEVETEEIKAVNRARKLKLIEHPYVCSNQSQVAPDPKKNYGYFKRTIVVQSSYIFIVLAFF